MDIYCDDIENCVLEIKTEPRNQKHSLSLLKPVRIPLKGLKINNNELTPELKFPREQSSISEPVINLKIRSRIIPTNQEETNLCKVNPKKLNVKILAKILDHDTFIEDLLGFNESNEQVLFNFLENEGRLSPEVLKAFCKSTQIFAVNMTRSYAGTMCESGLISAAKYSAKLCTKQFYCGFQQLLTIDFTNVKLGDDELRYIIRLSKLQALGLSGTLITDKGIKYLSIHSTFKTILKCLKLCFLESISDLTIKYLKSFTKLKSLDLRGNKNITLVGCLELIKDTSDHQNFNILIKLPENVHEILSDLHFFYEELSKTNANIILDPSDVRISTLSKSEIKSQLVFHKQVYSDIYLNQDMKYLQSKFIEIVKRRKKEEYLYSNSVRK